jgi:Ca2+-binding RTX toxin-like protein
MRRLLAVVLFALPAVGFTAMTAPAQGADPLREVMWVGNNWAGTATVIDAHSHEIVATNINLVPDKAAELNAILTNPVRLAFYLAIQQGPGEGHDQYVDDMFTTNDGKYLAVSRPSFADVVWVDIAKALDGQTDSIVKEQSMDGHRSDHMGLSPDGKRLLVSDSTEMQVIEYSMEPDTLGDRLRTFPSGETPHESNYSDDGERIYHASIGKVYTPGDDPLLDAAKGDRWFQTVSNDTFDVLNRWDMGKELAEAGHPNMSSAVRPMAITTDERFAYFQVSFFHGFVEFDFEAADIDNQVTYSSGGEAEPRTGAVTRLVELPNHVPNMLREQYVNDSAHHGLAIDETDSTLCVAGTMDDYVALVDRSSGDFELFNEDTKGKYYGKPYWSTEGPDNTCWISLSDADSLAILDFETGDELAYLPVGDHPQRVRLGVIPADAAPTTPDPTPSSSPLELPGPGLVLCGGLRATITGTGGRDVLTGTSGDDVIAALGGNDTVIASGGNDVVCGGPGNDALRGGSGKDRLFGENGKDRLSGGPGNQDYCRGGGSVDRAVTCEKVRSL